MINLVERITLPSFLGLSGTVHCSAWILWSLLLLAVMMSDQTDPAKKKYFG